MKKVFKFTDKAISNLAAHDTHSRSASTEYTDQGGVTGLKLLVGKTGKKSFLLRFTLDGRKGSIKIGEFGALTVNDARARANELRKLIHDGIDPRIERQRQRDKTTLKAFVQDEYLPHARQTKRSHKTDESKFIHHILPRFGSYKLENITTKDIQRYLTDLKSVRAAATVNRHISLLHHAFSLAIQWGHIERNPVQTIRKFQENNQRQRFLTEDEVRRLFKAAEGDHNRVAGCLIPFLLVTGIRLGEALSAQWIYAELESKRPRLFIPHTKSGKSRYVLLNPVAVNILKSAPRATGNPYLFPGKVTGKPLNNPRKAFHRMLKKSGIEKSFRIHDLRHSFASLAINNGCTLYEVQALLAHSNSRMTERYAHLSSDAIEQATQRVADVVTIAVNHQPENRNALC